MTPDPGTQRDVLMQVSTIDALVNGIYDGVMSVGMLKKYGDFGIGTFEGLDGEYVSGLNLPGYHVHFLTKERNAGGHVLDFTADEAIALLDYTTDFFMVLPDEDSDFYRADFTKSAEEELEKAEK